jgi:trehalose-6-phosphate synthase
MSEQERMCDDLERLEAEYECAYRAFWNRAEAGHPIYDAITAELHEVRERRDALREKVRTDTIREVQRELMASLAAERESRE